MAANTSPIFELTPIAKGNTFTSADTTALKTIFTAGTFGSRVDQISIETDDTAAVNLAFYINDGATDFYIGVVNVPIGSGYTTVPLVDGVLTLGPTLGYIVVPAVYLLKANCVATMTAAKTTTVLALGGDF